MAAIKKFNWVRRPSTWEFAQSWNAQRKSMASRFLDDSAVASSAFLNAQSNLSSGMATLAAQAAVTAAQRQLQATKNQLSSLGSSLDVSA